MKSPKTADGVEQAFKDMLCEHFDGMRIDELMAAMHVELARLYFYGFHVANNAGSTVTRLQTFDAAHKGMDTALNAFFGTGKVQ